MKLRNYRAATVLSALILATALSGVAADKKQTAKPKPYSLKTCAVSGEALDSMGDPFVFTHKDREIKLCCKGCKKDFDKEPAKFIKKVEKAEKEIPAKKS